MKIATSFVIAVLAAVAHDAAASVLVVGSGQTYSQIATAVAAAQSGDTILVKDGWYGKFTVDGKGLTIVADRGATVFIGFLGIVPQRSTVTNLLAHQTVVLRGIDGPLAIFGNAGTVRLEECNIVGERADCSPLGCFPPTPGVLVSGSPVAIVRSTLKGGAGSPPGFNPCTNGAAGLAVSNAEVVLYDTTLVGGDASGGCSTGLPFESVSGTGSVLDGLAPQHSFSAASTLRRGQVGSLDFVGPPGETAILLLATGTDLLPAPQYQGVLLVGPILSVVAIGAIPASGTLSLPVPNTSLPPIGVPAMEAHLQAAYATGAGHVLAAPSIVTLLDPSY